MQELYTQLAELLEVPEVKPTDVLKRFDAWDSLTILTIIAMLDSKFGVRMSGAELRDFHTVAELEQAVAARKTKS